MRYLPRHMSSALCDDASFSFCDFGPIWDSEMPDKGWTPERWEQTKLHHASGFAYGMWAKQRLLLQVGWVEHTNDWDLGVSIVKRDGTSLDFGHGSDIVGMRINGVRHVDLESASENLEYDPDAALIVNGWLSVNGDDRDYEDLKDDEETVIPVRDILTISIYR